MPTNIQIFHFGDTFLEEKKISQYEDIAPYLQKKSGTQWIHINGFKDKEKLSDLLTTLNISSDALKEIHDINERPKYTIQNNFICLNIKIAQLLQTKNKNHHLSTDKIYLFFNEKIVITLHDTQNTIFTGIQKTLQEPNNPIQNEDGFFLAYLLMDTMIDSYMPAIELYGDLMDDLENHAIAEPNSKTYETIHGLKKHLTETKKALWHFSEILRDFTKAPNNKISAEKNTLFQNNLDQVTQYLSIIDGYKDATSNLVDLYFSSQGSKLNEIMKILTIVATIFTPLAYFTGVFGMNFYPESEFWNPVKLNEPYGYIIFGLTTFGTVYFMLRQFKRRGWLNQEDATLPKLMTQKKKR